MSTPCVGYLPLRLYDRHEKCSYSSHCDSEEDSPVCTDSVCQEAHDYVCRSSCKRRRQEAQRCLNRRDFLHVLEEECKESLYGVEDTPRHKDANADGSEDTVAPQRVRNDGRPSQSFLSTDPVYEAWDQSKRYYERRNGGGLLDAGSTITD
jgi:hypothetical protein